MLGQRLGSLVAGEPPVIRGGGRMRRRGIVLLALPLLLAGCAAVTPTVDVTGRWVGTWTGYGVADVARDEPTTLNLSQGGTIGEGLLVMEGTAAAISVPAA